MASWRTLVQVGLLGVVVGGTQPAAAAKAKRLVAVFPLVVEGSIAPELIETIETALTERAPVDSGLRILRGNELRKRLKKNPRRAVNRCQRRRVAVTCFARLAQKLGADELLVGRAKATDAGATVLLLAVGRNRSVVPRGRFDISSSDAAEAVFTDELLRSFFGVTPVPEKPASEPVASVATEQDRGSPADKEQDSDTPAGKEGSSTPPSDEPVAQPRSDAAVVAALSPNIVAPMPIVNQDAASSGGATWLTYAGTGLAVIAAAAIGYGAYRGFQSEDVRSSIKRDGTLAQKQAVAKAARSNDLAREANLWMGAGAGGIAVGLTVVGLDILFE
jgi:hypothetical protein